MHVFGGSCRGKAAVLAGGGHTGANHQLLGQPQHNTIKI